MLSIGRPSPWQPVTDSLSSPAWASHGLLHKSISSFYPQISVPRFRVDFRFKPAHHGAEGTWIFSSWLARGRACIGGTVKSLSLGTNCCKVMSRLGSPLLPAPTCQDAASGNKACHPKGISLELRAFSWEGAGSGTDLTGWTWGDSQPHCSCKSGSVRERTNSSDPQQACAWSFVAVWGARHPFSCPLLGLVI